MSEFYVPADSVTVETVIKRSRFIATAFYMDDPSLVKNIVRRTRDEYEGCSHVVYAFITGKNREICGMSDDGEPKGTAGRPVLDVVKGKDITSIMVTVVRYFGGTKLGTGGLVHAYSDSAKLALEKLSLKRIIDMNQYTLVINYDMYNSVKSAIESVNGTITREDFSDSVKLSADIPVEQNSFFIETVKNITRGGVKIIE